jgi:hypothetical protein
MKKILIASLILFAACNRGNAPLEVESVFDIPEDKAINNLNDLEVLVNGAYQSLQAKGAYGSSLKLIPDLISDQVVINQRAYERNTGEYFTLYTRQNFGTADGPWRECYVCINRANAVLNAIDRRLVVAKSEVDQDNLNRIQGEAYFLRGLMHFELVRLWSHQYGSEPVDRPNSGVLLKLTPTTGRYSMPRSTTREVYESVQSDLRKAIDLLPEDRRATDLRTYGGRAGGRATKGAAQGILARVYFQKATPEDDLAAKELINLILPRFPITGDVIGENGPDFLIQSNYNIAPSVLFQVVNILNPFTNEGNSTAKPFLDSYYPEQEGEVTPFPTIYSMSSVFSDSIVSKSPGDRRILRATQGTNPRYTTKYKSPAASVNLNIPVIRSGELVVSRAEINASLGLRQEAIDDMVMLHKGRAFDLDTYDEAADRASLAAMSDKRFLIEIYRERSRELFTEGDRLHHFRRFYQRHGFNNKMGTAKSSYRIIQEITPKGFLFQIPDAEIAANPAVTRN